ncbi:nucleotidyltransferase family protein [Hahella sp. SMD15-11]|uniref:Nucleotidyltransferase family protein n=1 Tax=Thermohahella caldifontis TaxID=3142973 RepID=A0AB39UXP8_9GAMM
MNGCWVILASGYARRYGADKTLAPCPQCQRPMFDHVRVLVSGFSMPVAVVLRPDQTSLQDLATRAGLTPLINHDAEEGLAASLRCAAAWAIGREWMGVLLADMPAIRPSTLTAVMARAGRDRVARPLDTCVTPARPGHPVILGSDFFPALKTLEGDQGARELIRSLPGSCHVTVPVRDSGVWQDVDHPQDWASLTGCPEGLNVRQKRR